MSKWFSRRLASKLPISNIPSSKGGQPASRGKKGRQGGGIASNDMVANFWHNETTTSGASVTVTIGSAPVAGNTLIAACCINGAGTLGTPAGWNLLGSDSRLNGLGQEKTYVYSKTADGTETSVVFTVTGGNSPMPACVLELQGYSNTVSGFAMTGESTSGGVDVVGGTLANVPAGAICISIAACSTNTGTVSTACTITGGSWVTIASTNNTGNSTNMKKNLAVCKNTQDTGSVTGPTYTWNQVSENRSVAVMYLANA